MWLNISSLKHCHCLATVSGRSCQPNALWWLWRQFSVQHSSTRVQLKQSSSKSSTDVLDSTVSPIIQCLMISSMTASDMNKLKPDTAWRCRHRKGHAFHYSHLHIIHALINDFPGPFTALTFYSVELIQHHCSSS